MIPVYNMLRTYKRRTQHAAYGMQVSKDALHATEMGESLKSVFRRYGVPRKFLRRHHDGRVQNSGHSQLGRFRHQLGEDNEEMLDQIQAMEKALFGLTTIDVRRLAYEFATTRNLPLLF